MIMVIKLSFKKYVTDQGKRKFVWKEAGGGGEGGGHKFSERSQQIYTCFSYYLLKQIQILLSTAFRKCNRVSYFYKSKTNMKEAHILHKIKQLIMSTSQEISWRICKWLHNQGEVNANLSPKERLYITSFYANFMLFVPYIFLVYIKSCSYKLTSFPQIPRPKPCMHLSYLPCVPHAPPILFFSIWLPE
jgi:hypothetical protein